MVPSIGLSPDKMLLAREIMDQAGCELLVGNGVGHLCGGVSEKILLRAFEYWRNIDADIGQKIEDSVSEKLGGKSDAPGMVSAKSIGW